MDVKSAPNPLKSKWILIGLSFYSIMILGSMATMSIGIAFVLVFSVMGFGGPRPFLSAVLEQWRNPELKRYQWASHALNFACSLSLFFAYILPVHIGSHIPHIEWVKDLWKCWYFYWPFVVSASLIQLKDSEFKILLRNWFMALGILCLLGPFQFRYGEMWPPHFGGPYYQGHFNAFMGSYLSVASTVIFPLFLMLEDYGRNRFLPKRWIIGIGIAALVALSLTLSRMLWVALPIGFSVFLLSRMRSPRKYLWVGGFAVLALLLYQIPVIQLRMTYWGGILQRKQLWMINWEFFKMRPITGVGWHHNLELSGAYYEVFLPQTAIKFVGHAHSNFFEVIGSLGLLGLTTWLFWSWTVLRLARRVSLGLFCAWIVFHLNGITQVNFWESKVIHSMMFSIAIIFYLMGRKSPETEKPLEPSF